MQCLCLSLFLLILGMAVPGMAAAPAEQIKQTTDKILSVVADPALRGPAKAQEKRRLIRKAVDERFDWKEMARRSLAQHWTPRSPAEREEFVRLYADLLDTTYMSKIENYSGERVTYEGERIEGEYAAVKVRIVTRQNKDIPVEYRLRREGDKWLVYDISIEGVSLVNNYRTQFNSIILQSSYENLIKKLRDRVESE